MCYSTKTQTFSRTKHSLKGSLKRSSGEIWDKQNITTSPDMIIYHPRAIYQYSIIFLFAGVSFCGLSAAFTSFTFLLVLCGLPCRIYFPFWGVQYSPPGDGRSLKIHTISFLQISCTFLCSWPIIGPYITRVDCNLPREASVKTEDSMLKVYIFEIKCTNQILVALLYFFC